MSPTLTEQYNCAVREVRLRSRVYPRLVAEARMLQSQARHELACMQAIVATLGRLLEARSGQQDLFDKETTHDQV